MLPTSVVPGNPGAPLPVRAPDLTVTPPPAAHSRPSSVAELLGMAEVVPVVLPATPAVWVADPLAGFAAWHADRLQNHYYAARFNRMTKAGRAEEVNRAKRRYLIDGSEFYAQAHHIYLVACQLHDRMESFAKLYCETHGADLIAAAGLPSPDPEYGEDPNPLGLIREEIVGHSFNIDRLAGNLRDVSEPRRRARS